MNNVEVVKIKNYDITNGFPAILLNKFTSQSLTACDI